MHATHSSFSAPSRVTVVLGVVLGVVPAALAALAAAACAPAVPANPSWEQDVKPILAANCVRCHRSPSVNGAPSTFQFDECEDASATLQGAAAKAGTILARVTLERDIPTTMPPPPAAELTDRQIEILTNWQANGAPCTGTAAAPSFVLLRATEESVEESLQPGAAPGEQQLALRYTLEDPAHRLVNATVVAVSASGETHVAPEPLRAGTGELVWTLGTMAPGTYDVLVTLDDGSEIREVRTGTFAIGR